MNANNKNDSDDDAAIRILKKYPNRRIYDTHDSVYIKLDDVRKMVV